jgi:hypothetical protein
VNNKEELYESLVRLWILIIFAITLVAGTVGLILVCRMLVESDRPRFINSYKRGQAHLPDLFFFLGRPGQEQVRKVGLPPLPALKKRAAALN